MPRGQGSGARTGRRASRRCSRNRNISGGTNLSIRRKFAALAAGALLSAAAALPEYGVCRQSVRNAGLWTLDPTPYTFLTQMHADGAPFWTRFALTNPNSNAHSGGFRAMKCDGLTAIGDYADFGIPTAVGTISPET